MKKWSTIVFLLVLLGAISCTSRKKIVSPAQPQAFEWLCANIDVKIEGDQIEYEDLSGQLRIRKDSLVWLSMNATFGVEVMRMKMDADSIWVINRMEKTYLAEPLDSISVQLGMPINLPLIQTLLLDNNQDLSPVENQTVLLKNYAFGNYAARIKYTKVKLDERTSFPLKITHKMERVYLPKKK